MGHDVTSRGAQVTDEKIEQAIQARDAEIIRQYGPGHIEMERCPLCGLMRFLCCRTAEPNGVSMREMFSVTSCSRCEEIHRRAPEIFEWIVGVVQYLRVDSIKR